MKTNSSILLLIFLLISCVDITKTPTKILVIGDVQLKSDLKMYNSTHWKQQRLDTIQFSKFFQDVINRESPDFIFQTGDWVNYNNSLSLRIKDTFGLEIKSLKLPYDEWAYMNSVLPENLTDKFFMTVGNHESYKKIVIEGIYNPSYDILGDVKQGDFLLLNDKERYSQLIERFPHLVAAEFHKNTATYLLEKDDFILLSIDGYDKNRKSLLEFIDLKLSSARIEHPKKKIIVMCHYPIYTGRKENAYKKLVLSDIRENLIEIFNKYNVDLYLNGHEHFYLRYKDGGLEKSGFLEDSISVTNYLTIANFVNPYARKFERLDEYDKNDLVYFDGIHYSTIEIKSTQLKLTTFGYDTPSQIWSKIDSLILE